jgi:DNA repair ATPase RecN
MQILQTIIVKQILTEKSVRKLLETFQTKKQQLQKECQQLHFEYKKAEKNRKVKTSTLHSYYNKELESRLEKVKLLDFQIEQIHMLPLGSEIKENEVQAIIDVNIGDSWEDMSTKTILIKDGVVNDIR